MDDYKQKLNNLLTTAARENASDLHLAVGKHPTLRVDGILIPLQKEPLLSPESAQGIILELLTPDQQTKLAEQRQIDFAYSLEDKARFRANVYSLPIRKDKLRCFHEFPRIQG